METIEMLLENYATSINNGDLDLADKLFLQNENTSFIHPRGHEVGFDNVKEAFYVKTMINTDIITNGRESQTLIKVDDKWKIAHVHYSNMPVTGDKEGF